MDSDNQVPDLSETNSKALPYPHVPADVERFQPRIRYQQVGRWVECYAYWADVRSLQKLNAWREGVIPKGYRTETTSKDPERVKFVSSNRRRANIRKHCLMREVDHMWTFTTRPVSSEPEPKEVISKAFDRFQEIVKKRAPKFDPVWVFERQPDSGQWHIHAGLKGFYDVRWLRQVWYDSLEWVRGSQSVDAAGQWITPGQVDVTYKPGPGRSKKKACIKISSYIAKYVAKNTDEIGFNKKGYHHGKGQKLLAPASYFYAPKSHLAEAWTEFVQDYQLERAMVHKDTDFSWMQGGNSIFVRVPLALFNPPPF